MMKVYLAGPMFCDSEKTYNLSLRVFFADLGIDLVLPQENGVPGTVLGPDNAEELAPAIFAHDLALIDSCDALVVNLDGRVPDEGACVELGYAYAAGKPVFGIKTDVRVSEMGTDNMMISGMLAGRIAGSPAELAGMLRRLSAGTVHES